MLAKTWKNWKKLDQKANFKKSLKIQKWSNLLFYDAGWRNKVRESDCNHKIDNLTHFRFLAIFWSWPSDKKIKNLDPRVNFKKSPKIQSWSYCLFYDCNRFPRPYYVVQHHKIAIQTTFGFWRFFEINHTKTILAKMGKIGSEGQFQKIAKNIKSDLVCYFMILMDVIRYGKATTTIK